MDLYAEPVGARIEQATHYRACLGGSAGNIAAALCRLGCRASLVTCVSDDAIGRFTRNELQQYGVSTQYICTVSGESRTSLAVVETVTDNTQSVIYRNQAVDFELQADDVRAIDYAAHGALIIAGTALASQPSSDAVLLAMDLARRAEIPVILDIDYRPYSWLSPQQASQCYLRAAQKTDILIGNDVEFDVMAGSDKDGTDTARALADRRTVVYKMGERGALTFAGNRETQTGIFSVKALKPTGAGDAFMGGFCCALAMGLELPQAVERGSAAAAIVVTRVGCAPAMPTLPELETFLAEHGGLRAQIKYMEK